MKKQIVSLLVIAAMSTSLIVGCGNKEAGENTQTQSETGTTVETESESETELETETSTEIETTETSTETTMEESTEAETQQEQTETQESITTQTPTTTPDNSGTTNESTTNSGRYGGSWDYVDAVQSIYTGATLYTNATYGTSFTIPSTSQVYRDDHPNVVNCNTPIILTMCYPSNVDITLKLTFATNGNTETEALEAWRTIWGYSLWTCSDIYTTNIGGNTYYCMEATSPNGSSNELMLARQTGGKVIIYKLVSNSTKVTVDTAKEYILY